MRIHFQLFCVVLFFVSNTCSLFAQSVKDSDKPENILSGTSWKVNGVPFETEEEKQYTFSTFEAGTHEGTYGYFITFEDSTFSSRYAARCGNDCFTRVTGEYYFESAFKIHIKVLAIDRRKFCNQASETPNKEYGFYELQRTDTGWILIKV